MKLVFIGAGNMASAMIEGLLKTEHPFTLGITNRTPEKCAPFGARGVTVFDTNTEAAAWADMIVLAVKPQQYAEVLAELREAHLCGRKIYISIAAGVSTESVCRQLGTAVPVVRVMPNTPLLVGMGSTALSRNDAVTDAEYAMAERIFSASGKTMHLPEDKMNAVIAATGSSPAYIYLIIKAIYDEARREGVDAPELLANICEMVRGAAEMAESSSDDLDTLIKKVCSKGGTTERAMQVLCDGDLMGLLSRAMQACTDRAEEMSRQF